MATTTITESVLESALSAHLAGFSVCPPREDGTKAPAGPDGEWKKLQTERLDEKQLRQYYGSRTGIGVITGAISGNAEALDFDDIHAYEGFKALCPDAGLADLVERIEAGYLERSGGGAYHWLWRCLEISGNQKLARRPATPEELEGNPDNKIKTLIETRGEGGYLVIAPSFGKVHESGKPYVLLRGGFDTVATITPEERAAIFDLARIFDLMPKAVVSEPAPQPTSNRGDRPGDHYNTRANWREMLEPHGWKHVFTDDETDYWRRPGKDIGVSATTNHAGSDLLYVFSTSTAFESERGYSKFAAYTTLEHGGDYKAAAAALGAQGFGDPMPQSEKSLEAQDGIVINTTQDSKLVDTVLKLLTEQNAAEPTLFVGSAGLVRVIKDAQGRPIMDPMTVGKLLVRMIDASHYYRLTEKKGETHRSVAHAPRFVAEAIADRGAWEFPKLAGIVESPIMRPDGSILDQAGYDPATKLYYQPSGEFFPVAEKPGATALKKAIETLDDVLMDFPFEDAASRANTYAALFMPFLKSYIGSSTPIVAIDTPKAGTGKGLLTEVIWFTATGNHADLNGGGKSEEEWEKRITARLLTGCSLMAFDNLEGTLDSASLSRLATSEIFSSRLLGQSKDLNLVNNSVVLVNGNNIKLGGDLARRTCLIRLDRKVANPEKYTDFRHQNLKSYIQENRSKLMWSILTIARSWVVAGCKDGSNPVLGSFERSCRVIGGVLEHMGVHGYLGNMNQVFEIMDSDSGEWETFFSTWNEVLGDSAFTVSAVCTMLRDNGKFRDAIPTALEPELQSFIADRRNTFKQALGMMLHHKKDQVFGEDGSSITLKKSSKKTNVAKWMVVQGVGLESEIVGLESEIVGLEKVSPTEN
jgi:hypothetical protein